MVPNVSTFGAIEVSEVVRPSLKEIFDICTSIVPGQLTSAIWAPMAYVRTVPLVISTGISPESSQFTTVLSEVV